MKHILIGLSFIVSLNCFSQDRRQKVTMVEDPPRPISCDCIGAIRLTLPLNVRYIPSENLKGFGEQEISKKEKNSKYYFEEEHNTAWFLLSIKIDGLMTMEITPKDSADDYDFLLFSYNDSTFCDQFLSRKAMPLRSNISRGDIRFKGITGLSLKASNQYAIRGKGNPFSQYMPVKRGEKYMLVIDDVGPKFKGFQLDIHNGKELEFSGSVADENHIPLKTEITLEDNKGNIIHKTLSDAKGEYHFREKLSADKKYSLNFYNDSTVVESKFIDFGQIKTYSALRANKTVLEKLKAGAKFKVGSINFYGSVADLLPESFPALANLTRMLKKHKKMVIRIEGHVNQSPEQKLSEDRAQAVFAYLVKQGIEPERMSIMGFSDTRMLYPQPKDEYEQMMNRRVEINIISVR